MDLIFELLHENPAVIMLDALDECDATKRYQLLDALEKFVDKAPNLVQAFVSSRNDGDIVNQLRMYPNLEIKAADNEEEIRRFVCEKIDLAIAKKRLLRGKAKQNLRNHIVQALMDKAGAM
jgi:hypothetical protein